MSSNTAKKILHFTITATIYGLHTQARQIEKHVINPLDNLTVLVNINSGTTNDRGEYISGFLSPGYAFKIDREFVQAENIKGLQG